jgi:hypothetical protein
VYADLRRHLEVGTRSTVSEAFGYSDPGCFISSGLGRTILAAAGLHPESVLFRDARKANWQRGLKETAAIVCDSVTASELPKTFRAVQFPLVSETSLTELRRYEEFIRNPLVPSV